MSILSPRDSFAKKSSLLGLVGEDKKISIEPFTCSATQTCNESCILGDVVGDSLLLQHNVAIFSTLEPKVPL
jgi:hypothetical protein